MRKTALILFAFLSLSLGVIRVEAKTISPTATATVTPSLVPTAVVERINITETTPVVKSWGGVPENTIVLLLLLPLVATLVSLLHYVVGVSGYGIFTPTMMAVALLATGVVGGLALFAVILAITLLSNILLKKLKLHFWPARSITLLFVSLGTFGVMALSAKLNIFGMNKISIFPILFMILLTEEFVRTQLVKSKKEAVRLTIGTLGLAAVGALTMGIKEIQDLVLKFPLVIIVLVIVVNIIVGSYTGIRFTEIKRFKNAIRKK